MASKRNERLSKEEQEEEEMRSELQKAGVHDDYLTINDMKDLMKVLELSKNSSYQNTIDNRKTEETTLPLNNVTTQNKSDSLDGIERPISSFSYKSYSPPANLPMQSVSSEKQINIKENSPESDSNSSYGQNLNNQTNSPAHEVCDRNYLLNYPPLTNKSSLKTNFGIQNENTVSQEEWKSYSGRNGEEDDTPLSIQEHTHFERDSAYSAKQIDPEEFQKLYKEMSIKLDTLRQRFITDLPTEKSSLWGSPIKVATKWNGSVDKDPSVEIKEFPEFPKSCNPDISTRDAYDRVSKRKALTTIAAEMHDNENSDDEFENTKKRKFLQEKPAEDVTKRNQEKEKTKSLNHNEIDEIVDSDSDLFENTDLFSLKKSSKIKIANDKKNENVSANDVLIIEESEYPRRIIPPNPSKKNFKGPRAKSNTTQSQNNIIKSKSFLDDDEINKTLHEIDEQIHDNDSLGSDEIKPARLYKRIERAGSYLAKIRNKDEQKIKAEEEMRKLKEIEEKQKKEELINKRLQKQEDEKTEKQEKERQVKEKEIAYKKYLKNLKPRITTRSSANISRIAAEEMYEDLLLTDDDELTLTHSNLNETTCPICQKYYPSDEIASHASECQEYSSESHEINDHQPSTSNSHSVTETLECNICNKYRTVDGFKYEEHVNKCKDLVETRRKGMYCVN